jgi:RNA polymerase sigma factor (TIGR02999 family)
MLDPQAFASLADGRGKLSREQIDLLFSAAYEELLRLAAACKRSDPAATLTPTTLVHEAWIRLARSPGFAATSEAHFKRIAARAMRQILVDLARRRQADKRGGGDLRPFAFDDSFDAPVIQENDVVALHEALETLERMNPRHAAMVEVRFFGGLDVAATARVLGVSEETIYRDWRAVRAWLGTQVRKSGTHDGA